MKLLKKIKEFIRDFYDECGLGGIFGFLLLIGGIAVAILLLVGLLVNVANKINSGVVVDKKYSSGGSYANITKDGGYYYSSNPTYELCIEGEKEGEVVRYWFEVSPVEYDKYIIGDMYP